MVGDIAVFEGPWPAQFPGDLFGFVRLPCNGNHVMRPQNNFISWTQNPKTQPSTLA